MPAKPPAPPSLEDGDALEPRLPSVIPDTGAPDGLVLDLDDDVLGTVVHPVQLPVERDVLTLHEHLPTDGKDRVELLLTAHDVDIKPVHDEDGGGESF